MAVTSNKTTTTRLILELTGGDMNKLDQAIEKWRFKDYQSALRFCVSLLLRSEKYFAIFEKGDCYPSKIVWPTEELIKEEV